MRRSRGFSLIEAMFTISIFALVLSALAYSLGLLSRVSLARKDFGFELEALQISQLIRDDARNAQSVTVSESTLTCVGQNPAMPLTQRLEYGLSSPRSQATVVYRYTEGWLYRTVTTDPDVTQTAPVGLLTTFEIVRDEKVARVKFSSEKLNVIESFETVVRLP